MTVEQFMGKWGTFAQAIAVQLDADRHKWVAEMTADLASLLAQREEEVREQYAAVVHSCRELLPQLYDRYKAPHRRGPDPGQHVQCKVCFCTQHEANAATHAFPHDHPHCDVFKLETALNVLDLRAIRAGDTPPVSTP